MEKLRNLSLIESFRTNSIPAYSIHKITKKGILLLEDFNKRYYPKEAPLEKQKTIVKKIIEYKEHKELEPDEMAELTQSVVYSSLEVIGKEYAEVSTKKAEKLQNIAQKIVNKVRNY